MYSVERRQGRLIQVRAASPFTEGDVDGLIQGVRMNVIAQTERAICVSDATGLTTTMSSKAADGLIAMFTRDNPRVERSAILLRTGADSVALQIGRMIRAAKSASRMAFDDKAQLVAWLDEVLVPDERAELRAFFDGASRSGAQDFEPRRSSSTLPRAPMSKR